MKTCFDFAMDYSHPTLFALLAEQICRECVSLSMQNCSACKDRVKSHLLHRHHHLNLLETLREYFEPVRGSMLGSISIFYNCIEAKLPHSSDFKKDKMIYLLQARAFLTSCNAETIYWGRYVQKEDDTYIASALENIVISN